MMLVVVAGGAGFLGASLVDRLQAEGDEVVVVDDLSHGHLANLAEARRRGGVRFHRMDVSQGGLATLADRVRADAWVHLATAIDPVRAWDDPTGEAKAVVPGAVELLRAAAVTGARSVLASSGAYLYPAQLGGATKAGDVPRPVHPFGATRLALEAYAGAFTARGLDVVLLPLGTVYGPRQDPLGPGLVARAAWTMLQGRPPRVDGDGRQERDFLFVDDAVDAVARAVHASPAPGRVLVGTGTATGVLDVVEQLAAKIGWAGEPQWAPARPGDPRRSALDPAAAGTALGWQPWTRLDEGLDLTVDWLKARLPGHHRHIGR
jgi:UDP-glucose 4-epimerase